MPGLFFSFYFFANKTPHIMKPIYIFKGGIIMRNESIILAIVGIIMAIVSAVLIVNGVWFGGFTIVTEIVGLVFLSLSVSEPESVDEDED